jgi:hypothetical protein
LAGFIADSLSSLTISIGRVVQYIAIGFIADSLSSLTISIGRVVQYIAMPVTMIQVLEDINYKATHRNNISVSLTLSVSFCFKKKYNEMKQLKLTNNTMEFKAPRQPLTSAFIKKCNNALETIIVLPGHFSPWGLGALTFSLPFPGRPVCHVYPISPPATVVLKGYLGN